MRRFGIGIIASGLTGIAVVMVTGSLFVATGGTLAIAANSSIDYTGDWMPYRAFDELPLTAVTAGDSIIDVAIAPGKLELSREQILAWVARSARAVSFYYGTFPVKRLRLLIVPRPGDGVMGGQTFGHRGVAVRVFVGSAADQRALDNDWVMVHEMIHTALPRLDRRFDWLHEGISVYVESIARVQSGDLSSEMIWGSFVRAMPKGLPEDGDRGLDNTPTWGRTYWGGAIWCLLADIEIRRASGNTIGLQDALRGVMLAGGSYNEFWPIEEVLVAADKAIGQTALQDAYRANKDRPVAWDLDKLFDELGVGVVVNGRKVSFDDSKPLAAIRKSITEARQFN